MILALYILVALSLIQIFLMWNDQRKRKRTEPDFIICQLAEAPLMSETVIDKKGRMLPAIHENFRVVKRYISSCKTKEHLEVASTMLELFKRNYGTNELYNDLFADIAAKTCIMMEY